MRPLAAVLLASCLLLLAASAEPLPKDKLEYAGEWQGGTTRLVISPGGQCEYERRSNGNSVNLNAPIQRFEGDDFVVVVGVFTTTFVVSKPPHLANGRWRMVVDGVELTRVASFGEVRT